MLLKPGSFSGTLDTPLPPKAHETLGVLETCEVHETPEASEISGFFSNQIFFFFVPETADANKMVKLLLLLEIRF